MLVRVLEPEVMDSAAEALDYDAMDHNEVNRRFCDDILRHRQDSEGLHEPVRVLDVGTGTAQIPLELAARNLPVAITGIDLAQQMLAVGRSNIARANRTAQITLQLIDAKQLPDPDGSWDWVISNSIIHHIPEPLAVFREMIRVLAPGGLLFVRDLLRPDSEPELESLVQTYAGSANAHQQAMFRDSLHAALTLHEVAQLLQECGWDAASVQPTSDRHWTVVGRKPASWA